MKTTLLSLLAATVLLASCETGKSETKDQLAEADQDTAVMARDSRSATATADDAWDMTKAKLNNLEFKEITSLGVSVRGDGAYSIYSVEEKVLFDSEKAEIKPGATEALRQIMGSIGQRYGTSQVRVIGFADSRGDKSYNRELSEKRAQAVKSYLVGTGKIDGARVSTEPRGETMPVATNATPAGRQENRRVEIAVRTR